MKELPIPLGATLTGYAELWRFGPSRYRAEVGRIYLDGFDFGPKGIPILLESGRWAIGKRPAFATWGGVGCPRRMVPTTYYLIEFAEADSGAEIVIIHYSFEFGRLRSGQASLFSFVANLDAFDRRGTRR